MRALCTPAWQSKGLVGGRTNLLARKSLRLTAGVRATGLVAWAFELCRSVTLMLCQRMISMVEYIPREWVLHAFVTTVGTLVERRDFAHSRPSETLISQPVNPHAKRCLLLFGPLGKAIVLKGAQLRH